jgi:hypothetical protein
VDGDDEAVAAEFGAGASMYICVKKKKKPTNNNCMF